MNKRNFRYQNNPNPFDHDDDENGFPHSERLLQNIQQKLEKSAALNGGFDKLLYKIEGIENSQNQIGTKVDKIHEAIYHPDDGLFARIAANKSEQNENVTKIEKQVVELSTWQEHQIKSTTHFEKETNDFLNKLQKLEHSVENMQHSKTLLFSGIKWFGAAVGGGILTLLFKLFSDFFIIKH